MKKEPNLVLSIIPIIFLIIMLFFNVIFWEDTLEGSNQTALIFAAVVGTVISLRKGIKWADILNKIVETIGKAMPSILILLLIGALAGTWLISGVIPALIYYGLDILHPRIFLFATVVISALVSIATGSSWSTIATIGIALLGIGNAIEIDSGITAGAIISGAYFGDKISPLSDTTNLAPAMAGTDLFTHIRYMLHTTVPTMSITLIIFLIIGFNYEFSSASGNIEQIQNIISENFYISPILFLVPIFLIVIILRKVKPIPAIFLAIIAGAIFGIIFQSKIIENFTGIYDNYAKASYIGVMQSIYGDFKIETGIKSMNSLFETGGMKSMLNTIWLILSAMVFGGVMEAGGMLKKISKSILKLVNSTASLVASTAFSCMFLNITASDQYISIVVTGKMYKKIYEEKKLAPELLSRTLEDSGTVTSVLVPWNTCGATQASILNVPTLSYLPYAFFNIISPMMTIFYAYMNIKIRSLTYPKDKATPANNL